MFPSIKSLKQTLKSQIRSRARQGHDVDDLFVQLARLPDSYDAIVTLARMVDGAPMRSDWPYEEPVTFRKIQACMHPDRPSGLIRELTLEEATSRARAAFLSRVCGCVLGKPLEINPTLAQIRGVLEPIGAWPLRDYVPEAANDHVAGVVGKRTGLHRSWGETVKERIRYVAPDDDLNYTIIGMLVLERFGLGYTREDLLKVWLENLPVEMTFGPERRILAYGAMSSLSRGARPEVDEWASLLNPSDEKCGAMIRADAYGYAAAGDPALAAELAFRDASMTHRRTGVYGAMFAAAAIATAFVADSPDEVCRTALMFVPQESRFHEIAADCLEVVGAAEDWLEAYQEINARYGQYGHCTIYQETGFLMNALRFASDVGDGICKAVSQGADTDCYGATAGSIIGALLGPGALDPRWVAPFRDEIRTNLAQFYARSLDGVADRMAALPALTLV